MNDAKNADRGELPLLSGLRGVAAGIVLVSHAAIIGFLPSLLGHGFGQVGVMIFFVLSGFLMGHLYLPREISRQAIGTYLRARIGRVVPLYVAVIAISVVLTTWVDSDFRYAIDVSSIDTLAPALLFVSAPYELWTIPVEMQFYLAFIPAWWLFRKYGVLGVLVVAAAISVPAAFYFVFLHEKYSILPTYGFAFFIGTTIAAVLPRLKTALEGRVPAATGALVFGAVFINSPGLREALGLSLAPGQYYIAVWLDPITWALVCGLFVCCLLNQRSLHFLDGRAFKFLGDISYGLYLLHYPILELFSRHFGESPLSLIAGVTTTVGIAWLSHRYFEIPVMRKIRSYGAQRALTQ